MAGTWVADLPQHLNLRAGQIPLSDDARITWLIDQLGGIEGMDVLELGPLEASHTAMLLAAKARSVLAIEANKLAFLKCLIVKEVRKLERASFLLGDFEPFLRQDDRNWPLIVASGVLYHTAHPLQTLEQLAQRTDRLYLWTHVIDEAAMPATDPRLQQVTERVQHKWRDLEVTYYVRPYGQHNDPKLCGGPIKAPAWISRADLLKALSVLGFNDVRIAHEAPDAAHGPSLSILAIKTN